MVLNTQWRRRRIVGHLTGPKHFTETGESHAEYYELSDITQPVVTRPVVGKLKQRVMQLLVDSDVKPLLLADTNHLLLDFYHGQVPPLRFQRVPLVRKSWSPATGPSTIVRAKLGQSVSS